MKKCIIFVAVLFIMFPMSVYATETEDVQEKVIDQFDFHEIDEMLEEIFPNEKLIFRDVLTGLITGNTEFSLKLIVQLIADQFTYELRNSRSGMIHILLLVIIAAIFSNFSSVFKSTQVAEISFSMLYMFLLTICLNNFRILVEGASLNLERLLEFMKLLGPVYFLSVAVASGSSTSVVFYQLVLLIIFLVELLILNCLLPLTQIYLMIRILSELSPAINLTKFAELIETIVSWTLRTLLAGIIGLNLIQGLLAPAIDSVKRSVLTKSGEAIPIIGNIIGGTTEVVLGTAVLIKNGIGVVGMIICVIICIVPLVQMVVTSLLYQLIAALIQPISDKRMVECVSSVAVGTRMLLRVVFTTGMLFLLTIAVVATTSTGG